LSPNTETDQARQASAGATSPGALSFDGVKVFSATLILQRQQLGETVTDWLSIHRDLAIVDIQLRQSSDASFHCISICIFYQTPRS
jgi:hypothetical protein